jgi:hypothetical protein
MITTKTSVDSFCFLGRLVHRRTAFRAFHEISKNIPYLEDTKKIFCQNTIRHNAHHRTNLSKTVIQSSCKQLDSV